MNMRISHECAFCGHPDHRHRTVEAIEERIATGESEADVLEDYGLDDDSYESLVREVNRDEDRWRDVL